MRQSDLTAAAAIRAALRSGESRRGRKAAGVNAAEIARALGVSRTTVGDWEAGRRVPTTAHALAYGHLLRELARRAA